MSTPVQEKPTRSTNPLSVQIGETIAAGANSLDRGEGQSRAVLELLAADGALDLGAPFNNNGELAAMAGVISELSSRCMSSAFTTWAHRMTIEYLTAAATPYAERMLPALRSGQTPGISGMASAFRELAGCGSLEITATPDVDGYLLNGPIRWASNIYDDALLVTGVRTGTGERLIVALPVSTPGIKVGAPFSLLALGSTASTYMTLTDVRIGVENVLTRDFEPFLGSVRPTFMVLQTAMCAGLARTCIAEARQSLAGVNAVFAAEVESMAGTLALVASAVTKTAQCVAGVVPPSRAELLALRLAGAEVATGAATLEAKTAGGKGYASSSGASRRFRESAFIPVQSPSEAQLRWELAQCGQ
ncbi:MAG: acyl-CoA dehydrogenase family protein [Rhodococcus sp. (in: high G+C Gram-positive bacteria)]